MNKSPEILSLTPCAEDIGTRIDKFIPKYIDNVSRTQIQSLIEQGLLTNSKEKICDRSYKVKDETYQIIIPAPTRTEIKPKEIPLSIIFEDEDILVINKQAGLTTHPGAGNYDDTLVNALINYLGDNLSSIAGIERPGIVHRLDKDTSGLMLVAKTNLAHQHLSQQLKTRELRRIYHACCWGVPLLKVGKIDTFITRHKTNRLKMNTSKYSGKSAITNYKLVGNFDNKISLIECSLQTGRTHQIRVHMAHINHPIIGDGLYSNDHKTKYTTLCGEIKEICKNFPRQALQAKKIGFIHPKNAEYMEFEVDYDSDLKQIIEYIS